MHATGTVEVQEFESPTCGQMVSNFTSALWYGTCYERLVLPLATCWNYWSSYSQDVSQYHANVVCAVVESGEMAVEKHSPMHPVSYLTHPSNPHSSNRVVNWSCYLNDYLGINRERVKRLSQADKFTVITTGNEGFPLDLALYNPGLDQISRQVLKTCRWKTEVANAFLDHVVLVNSYEAEDRVYNFPYTADNQRNCITVPIITQTSFAAPIVSVLLQKVGSIEKLLGLCNQKKLTQTIKPNNPRLAGSATELVITINELDMNRVVSRGLLTSSQCENMANAGHGKWLSGIF